MNKEIQRQIQKSKAKSRNPKEIQREILKEENRVQEDEIEEDVIEERREEEEEGMILFTNASINNLLQIYLLYLIEPLIQDTPSAAAICSVMPELRESDLKEERKIQQFAHNGCKCTKGPGNTPCCQQFREGPSD